jgi:hypothetical protein
MRRRKGDESSQGGLEAIVFSKGLAEIVQVGFTVLLIKSLSRGARERERERQVRFETK